MRERAVAWQCSKLGSLFCLLVLVGTLLLLPKEAGASNTTDNCLLELLEVELGTQTCGASYKELAFQNILQSFKESCGLGDDGVNVMVPSSLGTLLKDEATASRFSWTSIPYGQYAGNMIGNLSVGEKFYDGFAVESFYLPYLNSIQALTDLTNLAATDQGFQWSDINKYTRETTAIDSSQVVGIPLGSAPMVLFYRRDLLPKFPNMTVPDTWDELLDAVREVNGTDEDGEPFFGICMDVPGCGTVFQFMAILAPFLQTKGSPQGLYFDPTNMAPLVNNPAGREALRIFLELVKYSPRKDMVELDKCTFADHNFDQGHCFFTFNLAHQYKLTAGNTTRVRGKLGTARLPGTTKVLSDRHQSELQDCWYSTCGYAEEHKLGLLNRAPFAAHGGYSWVIAKGTSQTTAAMLYKVVSQTVNASANFRAILAPQTTAVPWRHSSLKTDDLSGWTNAGYDTEDIRLYLQTISQFYSSPNIAQELRLPVTGTVWNNMWGVLLQAARGTLSPDEAIESLHVAMEKALTDFPADTLKLLYQTTVGYVKTDQGGSTPDPQGPISPVKQDFPLGILLGAVLGGVFALVVGGYLLWKSGVRRNWRLQLVPPGPGLDTTLIITDIEDSTSLWELLPSNVMDAAVKAHHQVMRRQLLKYNGYEFATEGDSFLMAFHTPRDAVLFAASTQKMLMQAAWPEELLEVEKCRPIYANLTGTALPVETSLPMMQTSCSGLCLSRGRSLQSLGSLRLNSEKLEAPPQPQVSFSDAEVVVSVSITPQGTFKGLLSQTYRLARRGAVTGDILLYKGLRVRMGIHSGIDRDEDVHYNRAMGRVQYGGSCLAGARVMCDSGHGGMVLMSAASFQRLDKASLPSDVMILDLGLHRTKGASKQDPLYGVQPTELQARWMTREAVKGCVGRGLGALEAPMGWVTLAVVEVVGSGTLLSWNGELASGAFEMFEAQSRELLHRLQGYEVESGSGHMVAAFHHPWEGLLWSMKVHQTMLTMDWDPALLDHELCEELRVGASSTGEDANAPTMVVVFRGLRLKIGLDTGNVSPQLDRISRKVVYKGKVLQRATKACSVAGTGQVFCTGATWKESCAAQAILDRGITATNMSHQLQGGGVHDRMEVYWCRPKENVVLSSRRGTGSTASYISTTLTSQIPSSLTPHDSTWMESLQGYCLPTLESRSTSITTCHEAIASRENSRVMTAASRENSRVMTATSKH